MKRQASKRSMRSTPKRRNTNANDSNAPKRRKFEYSEFSKESRKVIDIDIPAEVLTFGTGDAGQLGLGSDILERKRPAVVKNLSDIVRIKSGGMHSICLTKDGEVFTFGCNDEWALGRALNDDEDSNIPGKVYFPKGIKITDITAGDSHSVALSEDGKIYVWGAFRDNNGVIGLLRSNEKINLPEQVKLDKFVLKITSGNNHVAVLVDDGTVWTFGVSENGQLGRVSTRNLIRGGRYGVESLFKPEMVRTNNNVKYCDIWAGSYYTVGRGVDGKLYGCGINNYRQLLDINDSNVLMMTALVGLNNLNESFRLVCFGQHYLMVLTESSKVFCVGRGEYGSLGQGNNENVSSPMRVPLGRDDVQSIACCNRTSYVVFRDGSAVSWGVGDTYMLGHGDDEDVNSPTAMIGKQLDTRAIVEIAPGAQHVVMRAISREKFCLDQSFQTSMNSSMILGDVADMSTSFVALPKLVEQQTEEPFVKQLDKANSNSSNLLPVTPEVDDVAVEQSATFNNNTNSVTVPKQQGAEDNNMVVDEEMTEPVPQTNNSCLMEVDDTIMDVDMESFVVAEFKPQVPVVEEPKIQEPVVEEPKIQEPVVEEPKIQEPVVEEPKIQEPVVEEPKIQEPVVKEQEIQETVVEEPKIQEPVVEELEIQEPVVEELEIQEPVVEESNIQEPVVEESNIQEPVVEELEIQEPVVEELEIQEPVVEELEIQEPVVEEPNIQEPVVEELEIQEHAVEKAKVHEMEEKIQEAADAGDVNNNGTTVIVPADTTANPTLEA